MITQSETHRLRPVLEAIRDLASGRKKVGELTITTSEKLTVFLACDLPLPSFCKSQKDAWELLDELQRRTVATINPRFQAKQWAEIPVHFA